MPAETLTEELTTEEIHALPDDELNKGLADELCKSKRFPAWTALDEGWRWSDGIGFIRWVPCDGSTERIPDFCHDHGLIGQVAEELGLYALPVFDAVEHERVLEWMGMGDQFVSETGMQGYSEFLAELKTRALSEVCFWLLQERSR